MKPVRHAGSNLVYRGPTPDIGDLWCQRVRPQQIRVVYEFTDAERELIAAGGRVELAMYHEPIPSISMAVLPEGMCRPVGEHGWKGQTAVNPEGNEEWPS
ncbi:MAG: hypothetical protein RB191_24370 [Terriglobia bacterium]|nr:hypothetical protein [Terriglobia bacterium]